MLTLRNIQSGYEKLQILFGVDLDAHVNEITLLIGPNGAGKSTVLKTIFKLADMYHGSVTIDGVDLGHAKTDEVMRYGLVYIPQGRPIFPNLTVRENIELGGLYLGRHLMRDRLQDVFQEFPMLALKAKQSARLLSGGQQQLLALGRALMMSPRLLLLDEPSMGLSPIMMLGVFEKLVQLKKERGIGTLLVEQNAKAASAIADKVYLLENGQVVLHGNRGVLEDERVKRVYLGGV